MPDQENLKNVVKAYEKLSKKIRELSEFEHKVIVLCSFLEQELSGVLEQRLRAPINSDSKLNLTLFENNSLCYQLRFYEKDMCIIFRSLIKLRNIFSHQIDEYENSINAHIENIMDGDGELMVALKYDWENAIIPELIANGSDLESVNLDQKKFLSICMMHIASLSLQKEQGSERSTSLLET